MVLTAETKAIIVAVVGASLLVLVGGVLASNSGLLFVAGITAALVGLVAAGSTRPKPWARRFSVGVAVVAVLVGAFGTWLIALAQGGDLGLLDFLWATTGVLVPAELLIAAIAASWGAGAGPIRA
jgi:hypothetical protein